MQTSKKRYKWEVKVRRSTRDYTLPNMIFSFVSPFFENQSVFKLLRLNKFFFYNLVKSHIFSPTVALPLGFETYLIQEEKKKCYHLKEMVIFYIGLYFAFLVYG
jgi:hypothetical protein